MKIVLVLALFLAGCSKPAPVAPDPSLHPNDIGHNKLLDHFGDSLTKGKGAENSPEWRPDIVYRPGNKIKSKHLKTPHKSSETYEALMAEHGVEFSEGFFEERLPLISMKLALGDSAFGCFKGERLRSIYAIPVDSDGTEWTFTKEGYWCVRDPQHSVPLSQIKHEAGGTEWPVIVPTQLADAAGNPIGIPVMSISPLDVHGCHNPFTWNSDTSMCSTRINFDSDKQEITCSPIVEGTIICQYKPASAPQ